MKLRTKILALTIGLIMLLGLAVVFFVKTTLTQTLLSEFRENSVFQTRQLAGLAVKDLLTENRLGLQMLIDDFRKDEEKAKYIFILNSHKEPVAHSFGEGFPSALMNVNSIGPGGKYSIQRLDTDAGEVIDIAAPILDGVGFVHVGFTDVPLHREVDGIVALILKILAIVLAAGSGAAAVLASVITRPVRDLTETAKAVGSGNLERKAPVGSSDELGLLAAAFNEMTENLRYTTISRDYLDRVINSMIDMVLIIDGELTIKSLNQAVENQLGYSREYLRDKSYSILCGDKESCHTNIKRLREENGLSNIETSYKTKSGALVPVVLSASLIRGDDGGPGTIVVVAKDNTEYKRSQDNLYESRQLLVREHEELNKVFKKVEIAKKEWERTINCVGDMIILTDDDGGIKRVNRAVTEFTGKSFQEILGNNWDEMLSESGLEATTLYAGGTELFHGPSKRWFELNSYVYRDSDLDFSGNVITLHETTEIKTITEELEKRSVEIEEHRNKLKKALEEISSLMENVIQKKDFSIKFYNPNLKTKCYELKNCTKKDCPCYGKEAMRCWKVAGTFCGGNVQGAFAQKYENCAICNVYKEATTDPIYQIGEHFNNMMHILKVKNGELEAAYAELKATQAQILQREKMASIGQLAAGVAHEINNPMGFISSNLGTLGKYTDKLTEFITAQTEAIEVITKESATNVSSDVIPACRESFSNKDTGQVRYESLTGMTEKDTIEKVQELRKKLRLDYILKDVGQLINESIEGADRVKKIVQNLKTFSRLDEADYKHANINECIESTLNIVWNELKYKTTVEKEYGELSLTKCYPQQLNQVFMNLLVNAAQAIEKQGEIRIKTWNGNGFINVSISDNGGGIPEDKLSRIFEPFYTTKPVGKGTGLGLSITYDIVKKHNGEITVESEKGKGTTFTVRIPVVEGR
ncbi:MAG: PAS domain S-box protein [Nitrospiraceae bacterium]|nr:MAG: PAS domain S-box protein [Nitrospiraceae bacterium]